MILYTIININLLMSQVKKDHITELLYIIPLNTIISWISTAF